MLNSFYKKFYVANFLLGYTLLIAKTRKENRNKQTKKDRDKAEKNYIRMIDWGRDKCPFT